MPKALKSYNLTLPSAALAATRNTQYVCMEAETPALLV